MGATQIFLAIFFTNWPTALVHISVQYYKFMNIFKTVKKSFKYIISIYREDTYLGLT